MHLHFCLTLPALSVLNYIPPLPLLRRDSLVHFIVWIKTNVLQLPLWGTALYNVRMTQHPPVQGFKT